MGGGGNKECGEYWSNLYSLVKDGEQNLVVNRVVFNIFVYFGGIYGRCDQYEY